MGAQLTLGVHDAVTTHMKCYLPKSSSTVAKRKLEGAARMMIADTFQQIMLDQNKFSRVNMSQKALAVGLADMVSAYLSATYTH